MSPSAGAPAAGATTVVPEPEVKASLAALGVAVPPSATAGRPDDTGRAASGLTAPLVLKAYGPGIVHKTELGAVVVGLSHDQLGPAAEAMSDRLGRAGIEPAGYLVEEQAPAGLDLLVGAVRRPGFGVVVALGLGGEWAEVVDDVVLALHPLTAADADDLLGSWRGDRLLDGYRGQPPLDRRALHAVLLAIAGPGGLVDRTGPRLEALECNPVRVSAHGAVALDARLLLSDSAEQLAGMVADGSSGTPTVAPDPAAGDLHRLLAPRRVAVAGASASGRPSFGSRALEIYRDLGWGDDLVAIHPEATEIGGVAAWPSVSSLPEPVDYLLVALPAARCAEVVAESAGRASFVHVISGGFAEAGEDGAALQHELADAARRAGVRLLGPNCMGIYSPAGRHAFQPAAPGEGGGVAVVSQSGGLAGDIVKVGFQRGLRYSAVVSLGNAADLSVGELAAHLLADPSTEALGLYLEGPGADSRLVNALRSARGRVPVVVLAGGTSEQGAGAASSHTGALAGDARLWEALSRSTGATVVDTLEDLLGVLRFHQTYGRGGPAPADGASPGVLVVGVGGGASVLATDACARAGLVVTPAHHELRAELVGLGFGVGMSVANPMEVAAGPLAPPDIFHRLITPALARQSFSDVLLHVNVQAYVSFGGAGTSVLVETLGLLSPDRWPGVRVAVVLRNQEAAPAAELDGVLAAAAANGVPTYRTLDEAARAVRAGQRFAAEPGLPPVGAGSLP